MSVDYKAQIVEGFELANNWNEIVDEDFFEQYIDNFLTASVYHNTISLFGVILEEVDEACFVECSDHLPLEDLNLLREFIAKYPKAVTSQFSSKYLICKEC